MQNGNGNGKRHVIERSPFNRSGEVIVKANEKGHVIPDSGTTHNMDRDFEVPHLTFKLTALADGAVCDPQPDVLDRFIKIDILDASRNEPVGAVVLTAVGDGVYRWIPRVPITLRRGDYWRIQVNSRESFDIAFDGSRKRLDAIRVEVTFEGELLRYAPYTEAHTVGVEAPLG